MGVLLVKLSKVLFTKKYGKLEVNKIKRAAYLPGNMENQRSTKQGPHKVKVKVQSLYFDGVSSLYHMVGNLGGSIVSAPPPPLHSSPPIPFASVCVWGGGGDFNNFTEGGFEDFFLDRGD